MYSVKFFGLVNNKKILAYSGSDCVYIKKNIIVITKCEILLSFQTCGDKKT